MKERSKRNPINTALALSAVAVLFFYLYMQLSVHRMLFQPRPSSYDASLGIEWVTSDDGTRIALYWARGAPGGATVLYFHGNAEDIGHVLPTLQTYQIRGYNIACFDYRSYGLTGGKPSEANVYADSEAVYRHLLDSKGVSEERLILHGRSLGSGAAVEMARRFDPAGVILESAFRSVYQLGLPVRWLPGDKFRNEAKVGELTEPMLVFHGEDDRVVPVEHGKRLKEAAGERALGFWVPGAGHNDLVRVAGVAYWRTIEDFIGKAVGDASSERGFK